MTLLGHYADVIRRPQAYTDAERAETADLLMRAAERPFTAAQAAEYLTLSKPTVLKLVDAKLLLETADSTEEARKLEPALVISARALLQRAGTTGTVQDRLTPLRALIEEFEANAIAVAEESGFEPIPEDVMARARARREHRLRQRADGRR